MNWWLYVIKRSEKIKCFYHIFYVQNQWCSPFLRSFRQSKGGQSNAIESKIENFCHYIFSRGVTGYLNLGGQVVMGHATDTRQRLLTCKKGAFNHYLDTILPFFDHHIPLCGHFIPKRAKKRDFWPPTASFYPHSHWMAQKLGGQLPTLPTHHLPPCLALLLWVKSKILLPR